MLAPGTMAGDGSMMAGPPEAPAGDPRELELWSKEREGRGGGGQGGPGPGPGPGPGRGEARVRRGGRPEGLVLKAPPRGRRGEGDESDYERLLLRKLRLRQEPGPGPAEYDLPSGFAPGRKVVKGKHQAYPMIPAVSLGMGSVNAYQPGPGDYEYHKAKDFVQKGPKRRSLDAAHKSTTRAGLPPKPLVKTMPLSYKIMVEMDWREKTVKSPTKRPPTPEERPATPTVKATSGSGIYSTKGIATVRKHTTVPETSPTQVHRPAVRYIKKHVLKHTPTLDTALDLGQPAEDPGEAKSPGKQAVSILDRDAKRRAMAAKLVDRALRTAERQDLWNQNSQRAKKYTPTKLL